ncbi:MAG: FecCD family ABC transporter permease [Cellulosilyticaceae bacterium]
MNWIKNRGEGNIKFLYFLLLVSVITLGLVSITIGVANITVGETIQILLNQLFNFPINETISAGQQTIILQVRVPRILLAMLTGANLAVTGAIYQSLFRNAMADPFMLGISSGASLGAGIGFLIGGFIPAYAFGGAIVANILVVVLAGSKGQVSTIRLLLGGMAINYFFSSFLSLIRTYSPDRNLTLFSWGMGSLAGGSYERVGILAVLSIPILTVFYIYRKELNLLSLGDDHAKSLGVDVNRIRKLFLVLSSLVIAATVSFTGTVGFVGLIIPHMVRLLFGSNYKYTLLINLFFGMLFVMLCDNISRTFIPSSEVPLGIVTSLFGAPYFMYLIYQDRKRSIT